MILGRAGGVQHAIWRIQQHIGEPNGRQIAQDQFRSMQEALDHAVKLHEERFNALGIAVEPGDLDISVKREQMLTAYAAEMERLGVTNAARPGPRVTREVTNDLEALAVLREHAPAVWEERAFSYDGRVIKLRKNGDMVDLLEQLNKNEACSFAICFEEGGGISAEVSCGNATVSIDSEGSITLTRSLGQFDLSHTIPATDEAREQFGQDLMAQHHLNLIEEDPDGYGSSYSIGSVDELLRVAANASSAGIGFELCLGPSECTFTTSFDAELGPLSISAGSDGQVGVGTSATNTTILQLSALASRPWW